MDGSLRVKSKIWLNSTTEDNMNEAPLAWSVSPLENGMRKIKNFHAAIQSNNAVFGV